MSRYEWPRGAPARAGVVADKDDAGARAAHNARRQGGTGDAQARQLLRQVAEEGNTAGVLRPRAAPNSDNLLWQPLGPAALLRGQAEGGPRVSGRVNALCVHPDGLRAYAASANGGVWATTDGGKHWQSVAGLASTNVAGIKRPAHRNVSAALHVIWRDPPTGVPPRGNEIVFMGTGEPHKARSGRPGHAEDGLGIFVAERPLSSAAADPWQREAVNLVNDTVYAICSSPDGSTIVAAARSGLYQRPAAPVADVAWQPVAGIPFGTTGTECTDVLWTRADPDDGSPLAQRRPERLWVWVKGGDNHGLWVRDAGQADFSAVEVDSANSAFGYVVERGVLAAAPQPTVVWLLMDLGGGNTGLFRVSNPKRADGAPKALAVEGVPNIFRGTGWYNIALAVDPGNQDRVAMAGSYLGSSRDAADVDLVTTQDGATRSYDASIVIDIVVPKPTNAARLVYGTSPRAAKMIGMGVHPDMHALCFSHNGNTLWAGCDGGIYRSDRPTSSAAGFYACNNGLSISEPNFIGASAAFEGDLLIGLQDNGVAMRLSGSVWRVVHKGDGGGIVREPHRPERWMAQYTEGVWSDPSAFGNAGPVIRPTSFNKTESEASAFYSMPAVIGHQRGGNPTAQLLIGTTRPWYSDDFGSTWSTLPEGKDALKTLPAPASWDDDQDRLSSAVVMCRWQDADNAWVLTHDAVYRLQRTPGSHEAGGAGTWAKPALKVLDLGKAKKRGPPVAGEPLSFLRFSPTWTEIEPNLVPAAGAVPARSALYMGTVGHPSAAGVDTLWWFDGDSTWVATELATRGNNGTPLPAPVTAILVDPALPDEVWVGTTVGVVHGVRTAVAAPAPGASAWHWDWTTRLNGLPEAPVEDLVLYKDSADPLRLLRAAIGARGVWELRLDQPIVPSQTYLRVHDGDLRHRAQARLLQADGVTERPWHASPDIRPRLAPSAAVMGPTAVLPWSRTLHGPAESLRRFQAALRAGRNSPAELLAGRGDPRIVANGLWDGYFSEVLRDHGAPTTLVVPAPPLPNQNKVQITKAFWDTHFQGADRTAEPWGNDTPTHADLLELTPEVPEGAAGEAACKLAASPWRIDVVVHHRGREPRDGADVRVTLLWWVDPARTNKAKFNEPAKWAALAGNWTPVVQAMLNSPGGATGALPAGWHYVGDSAATRRQTLSGQTLDPLNAGTASFALNLAGLPHDRLVLLVAVVRSGADVALANAPLRDLVLNNPAVAVRAVRIA